MNDANGVNGLVGRLNAAKESGKFKSTGNLDFLNSWEYKLGSEVLTPFGRSQLCESLRLPLQHLC